MPKRVTPRGQAAPPPQAEAPTPAKKPRAKRTPKAPATEAGTTKYARNIRGVLCRWRYSDGRSVELQPRGQRQDTIPVAAEDQKDPVFITNVGHLYEVLSEEEGLDVIMKQATNQQVGPTAFDFLVNERGEKMTTVRVEQAWEQQGTVVANLQNAPDGRHTQQNVEVERIGPQQVSVPGSPGTIPQVPSNIPADQVADWVARNAKGDNVGDQLLGQIPVRIDPVQRG